MSVAVVGWPLLSGGRAVIARAGTRTSIATGIALTGSRGPVAVVRVALTGTARTAARLWTYGRAIACGWTPWARGRAVLHRRPRRRALNRSRWWTVRNRSGVPAAAVAVERPLPIVAVPVAAYHEADDRYADLCAVGRHQHALILIVVLQIVAGDPAAVAEGDDIAPFPTIRASLDG